MEKENAASVKYGPFKAQKWIELQWSMGRGCEPWERLAEALRPEWIFDTSQ